MIGLSEWDGQRPVILVPSADAIEPIAANYPKASVIALPEDCTHLVLRDAWGFFLPLYGSDCTLWPIEPVQHPFFASLVPVLADSGVRTLRLATRALDEYARLYSLKTLWRDRKPHPGPPAGAAFTLRYLRAERIRAAAALVADGAR